jgi:anthranilate synthase component 2
VVRADRLMHGKTSMIEHDGSPLFAGIDNPFVATRYHSLIAERASLPACLKVTAWTDGDVIMALEHRDLPLWGLQFHPESILTTSGMKLLQNFLKLSAEAAQ